MTQEIAVSIIGTAGRKDDGPRMTAVLFQHMIEHAKTLLPKLNRGQTLRLVSGGAAWADHVAVMLFLENPTAYSGLTIYSPAPWNNTTHAYSVAPTSPQQFDAGSISNYYHGLFSQVIGRNTLLDIERAIALGAVFDTSRKGFKPRNTQVAKSDYLIAFTWGINEPADGGTGDTWAKSKALYKIHVPLSTL